MDCAVTDEAVRIICEEGLGDLVFPEMVRRIQKHMEDFGERRIRVEVIVFYREQTGAFVELAATEDAAEFMDGVQETAR